ncbi:MAG: HAMP domain-containing protein, partial [Leptolinea sp.]
MKIIRKSLYWKLTLAFILVAFSATAMAAVFVRVTSQDRLAQLIFDQQRENMMQSLKNYYAANGSWNGVSATWNEMQKQSFPTPYPPPSGEESRPTPDTKRPPPERERRNLFGLVGIDNVVIIPVEGDYPVGSQLPAEQIGGGSPVVVDEKTVGTILTARHLSRFNPEEDLFLERTNQALLLAIFTGLLVALVMGIILARTLTLPLRELTQAAQNIAEGHLEQEVKVTSNDEIGRLASAFNRMSHEVAKANASRRQMTADIAHDLRTPLT